MKKRYIGVGIGVVALLVTAILFFSFYELAVTEGSSMEPLLHNGNWILLQIRGFNASSLANGTIICYDYNATYMVCHRIVGVHRLPGEVFYMTQGDNNAGPDNVIVYPENITGVLVSVIWR